MVKSGTRPHYLCLSNCSVHPLPLPAYQGSRGDGSSSFSLARLARLFAKATIDRAVQLAATDPDLKILDGDRLRAQRQFPDAIAAYKKRVPLIAKITGQPETRIRRAIEERKRR